MRKVIITALVAVLALAFATAALGHTLDRDQAKQEATAYLQAIVDDEESGMYDFDLHRGRWISAHRRDYPATLYYVDEDAHADGACDVTVTVRFASTRSSRLKVYDRGDWDCDAEE